MRLVVTHLAGLALVWHLVLGCCAHHQHCRVTAGESHCKHHHDAPEHHHSEHAPSLREESPTHESSPPSPANHSDCHEAHCVALAVAAPTEPASPWTNLTLDCPPTVPLTAVRDLASAAPAAFSSAATPLPLRAAARSQILLN